MTEETTKNEVRKAVENWLEHFNSKNRDEFFKLFHPDIIYANDGAPLMRGIAEIKPWYEQAFETFNVRALFKEEAIIVEGNIAFIIGKFYMKPAEGDDNSGENGRVAMIFRRNEEGKWLLSFDMDNRPPDSTPEDFASASKESAYLPAEKL